MVISKLRTEIIPSKEEIVTRNIQSQKCLEVTPFYEWLLEIIYKLYIDVSKRQDDNLHDVYVSKDRWMIASAGH